MKNILKKSVTWLMILFLSVGTIGTFLPGIAAEAEAADEPKYMAKIVARADGNNDNRLGQFISVESGASYTLSYEIYVIEKGMIQGWAAEATCIAQDYNTDAGKTNEVEGTYVVPEGTTQIYLNFQCSSGEYYVWNIQFKKVDSDINLLTNANFSEGNGSWMNWTYSGWGGGGAQTVTSLGMSDSFEKNTGRKVILYNNELFSQNIANREELEFTGDPLYMAHIAEKDLAINQYGISGTPKETYVLTYNYYKLTNGNLQGRIGYSDKSYETGYFKVFNDVSASNNTWKSASVEYTLGEDEDKLFIRFEGQDDVDGYVWNVKLTEKNGDGTNLLKNSDFMQSGGTWIGWNIQGKGDIKTVEGSNEAGLTTNCEIVSYDSSLFTTENEDLANWSVQPILQETLDFTYKTTLKEATEATPTMTFVMKNGSDIVKEETVSGTLIKDGTNGYSFSLKVLPQQMAYTINATLNVDDSTQTKVYSVKKYCATILANEDYSVYLKDLVVDLVRYGSETQTLLQKENTIKLGLNSLMSGLGSNGVLANVQCLTDLISGENSGTYQWKSASLVLDGKVTIRFKFTASSIENLKIKVNDVDYDIKTAEKYYYVDIPMAATAFGDTVQAKFYENDTQTGATLSYSVNTYLYRQKDSQNAELMQCIYKYGQSAEVYKEYMTNGTVLPLDNELVDTWLL